MLGAYVGEQHVGDIFEDFLPGLSVFGVVVVCARVLELVSQHILEIVYVVAVLGFQEFGKQLFATAKISRNCEEHDN